MKSPGTFRSPVRSPQCLSQSGNATHVLWVATLMSLKKTRSHEDYQRLSALLLLVFSFAKALMGARLFCARYHLNAMHRGAQSSTNILLRVNVNWHINSQKTDAFLPPPHPGDWQHLQLLRGTKKRKAVVLFWLERSCLWVKHVGSRRWFMTV